MKVDVSVFNAEKRDKTLYTFKLSIFHNFMRILSLPHNPPISTMVFHNMDYYPTAADMVQITIQIYSDIVQLFVQ